MLVKPCLIRRLVGAALMLIFVMGCESIGPQTVARDRFDYAGAIGESWKSQMLLNLVKIRYGDNPVFLDVGQVVAGYSLQRSVAINGSASFPPYDATVKGVSGVLGGSAAMSYIDSPTITYSPLTGERFARAIMSSVPLRSIAQVLQSGFPLDVIFRLAIQSINGIDNSRTSGGANRYHPPEPEFFDLLDNLSQIQSTGDIGFRFSTQGDSLFLVFRRSHSEDSRRAIVKVKKLLQLDQNLNEFRLILTAVQNGTNEIAIVSRSIYEILLYIATAIEAPDFHIQEKRTNATPQEWTNINDKINSLVRIQASTAKPSDTFIAIPYRDYWFFIDDRDTRSKKIFSFILLLFTFVEPGVATLNTTLTIPVNR